jgi:hypothetical protein
MSTITATKSNFKVIPDDLYALECISYTIKKGDYGDYIQWIFEVYEGEHKGVNVGARTPSLLSPESKLHKFLKGFGYHTIVPEETKIDLNNCVKKIVRGITETSVDSKDDTKEYSNVVKLLPAEKPGAPQKEEEQKFTATDAPPPPVEEKQNNGLPPGWKEHTDADTGKKYYSDPSGKTQWEKPALPADQSQQGKDKKEDWDKYQDA